MGERWMGEVGACVFLPRALSSISLFSSPHTPTRTAAPGGEATSSRRRRRRTKLTGGSGAGVVDGPKKRAGPRSAVFGVVATGVAVPVAAPATGSDGFGYVDGHKFECSHVAEGDKYHHVFVLDCSGSMWGTPWTNLMAAWHEYVYNRISGGASLDVVSVVTFNHEGVIDFEAVRIADAVTRTLTVVVAALILPRGCVLRMKCCPATRLRGWPWRSGCSSAPGGKPRSAR